jgi:alpha-1,2-mannosyltransferase
MVAVAVVFVALQIAFLGLGGLLSLDRRPVLAGVLFGILTVKPQLGLLLPIILLLERRWVTIASTVMTIAVLFVVTAMLFGLDVWIDYWHKIVPQQMWLTENAGGLVMRRSVVNFI